MVKVKKGRKRKAVPPGHAGPSKEDMQKGAFVNRLNSSVRKNTHKSSIVHGFMWYGCLQWARSVFPKLSRT